MPKFLLFSVLFAVLFPQVFADSDIQQISNTPGYSLVPSITIYEDEILVAWSEQSGPNQPSTILLSKSTDGGKSFSSPRSIIDLSGELVNPILTTSGNEIYLTWMYRYPVSFTTNWSTNHSEIYFSKSTDGGESFSAPQTISSSSGFSGSQSITTDGKFLYSVWDWVLHVEKDRQEVYFSKIPLMPSNDTGINKIPATDSELQETPEPNVNDNPVTTIKTVKWLNENGADYTTSGIGVMRLDNADLNVNKTLIDIPSVHVWSDSDPKGIQVDVIETGVDTGVFYADIMFSPITSDHLQLHVSRGDTISVSCDDSLDEPIVDTRDISQQYVSVFKQLKFGVPSDEIECKESLILVERYDGTPACVSSNTAEKLIQRGWINGS